MAFIRLLIVFTSMPANQQTCKFLGLNSSSPLIFRLTDMHFLNHQLSLHQLYVRMQEAQKAVYINAQYVATLNNIGNK